MRNKLVAILALLLSCTAQADSEWNLVATNNVGNRFYIGTEGVVRSGDVVRGWVNTDLKTSERTPGSPMYHKSTASNLEFNCAEQMVNIRTIIYYLGPMTTGEVLHTENYKLKDWSDVKPRTMFSLIMKQLCQ